MTATKDPAAVEGDRVNIDAAAGSFDMPRLAEPAPFQPLPPLTAEEFAALRADVAEHGVVVPVVVDQHGRLLDGHHRRQVAAELGVTCPSVVRQVADDDEALDVAVTLNAARRHLTREQHRELIRSELQRRPGDSDRALARRVGCDHKTVGSVRRELQGGELPHTEAALNAAEAEARTEQIREARDGLLAEQVKLLRDGVPPLTLVGWLRAMFGQYLTADDPDREIGDAVRMILLDPLTDFLIEYGAEVAGSVPVEQTELARRVVEDDAAARFGGAM